jgi:adenylate kinase family enzyme
MAKLTFLLGLCGSGKTHIAERLATQTGAKLFSDFLQDQNKNFPTVVQNLNAGKDCIIDEGKYSIPRFREKILADLVNVANFELEWICFENDRASADWNVRHRKNKGDVEGHLRINEFLSDVYQWPEQAQILKVTRIDAE